MEWIKDWLKARYNLLPERAKKVVRIVAGIGILLLVLSIFTAGWFAGMKQEWWEPLYEVVQSARITLWRSVLAVGLIVGAVAMAMLIYQWIELTDLGKRLFQWHEEDVFEVCSTKTRNAGMLLCSLMVATILGLLVGVLR